MSTKTSKTLKILGYPLKFFSERPKFLVNTAGKNVRIFRQKMKISKLFCRTSGIFPNLCQNIVKSRKCWSFPGILFETVRLYTRL